MSWWNKIKEWLGVAQKETDEALESAEQTIKAGLRKVDEVARDASGAIINSDAAKKLDEWGRKIGGTRFDCPRCKGTGEEAGDRRRVCSLCKGTGRDPEARTGRDLR